MTVEKGKTVYLDLGFEGNPPVTLAWPKVFNAVKSERYPDSPPSFQATLLIRPDHPQYAALYNAVIDVALANYSNVVDPNTRHMVVTDPKLFKWPMEAGSDIVQRGAAKGRDYSAVQSYIAFRVMSYNEVALGAHDAQGVPHDVPSLGGAGRDEFRSVFYGGADVRAKLGIRQMKERSGIVVYLNMLAALGTGQKIPSLGGSEQIVRSYAETQRVSSTSGVVHPTGSPLAPPPPAQAFARV